LGADAQASGTGNVILPDKEAAIGAEGDGGVDLIAGFGAGNGVFDAVGDVGRLQ
jgi:hypothetical protein